MTAQLAAECRQRIAQRIAYQMDIGGVRTKDEREIVKRVIAGRVKKPHLKLILKAA